MNLLGLDLRRFSGLFHMPPRNPARCGTSAPAEALPSRDCGYQDFRGRASLAGGRIQVCGFRASISACSPETNSQRSLKEIPNQTPKCNALGWAFCTACIPCRLGKGINGIKGLASPEGTPRGRLLHHSLEASELV